MATRDKKWRIQWGLIAEAQILDHTSQPMYMYCTVLQYACPIHEKIQYWKLFPNCKEQGETLGIVCDDQRNHS